MDDDVIDVATGYETQQYSITKATCAIIQALSLWFCPPLESKLMICYMYVIAN